MSSNLGKTPKKAGGRFNTVATSTPTKSEPKVLKTAESSQSQAAHIQRTPVRGGALFHHASPGFHEDEEPVCQDNSSTIKVFVRVRPSVETDNTRGGDGVVSVPTTDTVTSNAVFFQMVLLHGSEPKPFTFDYAADPTTTQLEMFDMIGKPFTDSCLAGYNGSIFAYGQTGSGKTYTMQVCACAEAAQKHSQKCLAAPTRIRIHDHTAFLIGLRARKSHLCSPNPPPPSQSRAEAHDRL
eukprot:338622-Rhodomonas_salina.1